MKLEFRDSVDEWSRRDILEAAAWGVRHALRRPANAWMPALAGVSGRRVSACERACPSAASADLQLLVQLFLRRAALAFFLPDRRRQILRARLAMSDRRFHPSLRSRRRRIRGLWIGERRRVVLRPDLAGNADRNQRDHGGDRHQSSKIDTATVCCASYVSIHLSTPQERNWGLPHISPIGTHGRGF